MSSYFNLLAAFDQPDFSALPAVDISFGRKTSKSRRNAVMDGEFRLQGLLRGWNLKSWALD